MNKLEKFAKSTVIYFIGQMATKMISFCLLPLYSNRFSTENYGYFDLASSVLNVIVPLVCLEIWSCILRFMFDYQDEKNKYKVISNGLGIWCISLVVYSIGFLIAKLFFDIQFIGLIYLYGLVIMLQNLYGAIVRGLSKNWMYMISGVISSTAIIAVNIILILGFNMSAETLFISGIIGGMIQIIILEVSTKVLSKFYIRYFDKELLSKMICFSAPLCLNTIAFWLLNSYGRFPIMRYLGMEQNGIYAMANRFTTILSLFVTVFQLAWQELTFSIGNDDDREAYYSMGINLMLKFLGCCMLMLVPFTKLAFTLIGADYKAALAIIPMYYLGTLASSISAFLGSIFGAEKRNGVIMYSTIVAAAINVVVIQLTINSIGLHGVVLALFLGFFVNVIMRVVALKNYVGLKIDLRVFMILVILYAITTMMFYKTNLALNAVWLVILIVFSLFWFKDMLGILLNAILGMLGKKKGD